MGVVCVVYCTSPVVIVITYVYVDVEGKVIHVVKSAPPTGVSNATDAIIHILTPSSRQCHCFFKAEGLYVHWCIP